MKFSEKWLRSWVNPPVDGAALANALTMAGLEVATRMPLAEELDGIIVGHVLEVERHPQADKLSVCRVDTGRGEVRIVCGAPNVRPGLRSPLALPGAHLPGGTTIRKTRIRQVESEGMLCSLRELGLGEDSAGIMELPEELPAGADVVAALELDDHVLEVDLTPNRGDCLSIAGIAREVGTLYDLPFRRPSIGPVRAVYGGTLPIMLDAPVGCPSFSGRLIRGLAQGARTPLWMSERLRRSGIRPISPVVDVTNYVMLELGQPLHAYDRRLLGGRIGARWGKSGERLLLLDGRTVELDAETLVIADDRRVLGLAGIMGGETTGVGEDTTEVFLEAAFFSPPAIVGRARRYGLSTEASMRFERGVDPALQVAALERATALLTAIAAGEPGPIATARSEEHLPGRAPLVLRRDRLALLIGHRIDDAQVETILSRLEFAPGATEEGWQVSVPSHRFDIALEEDLVEEVARIFGYDRIPEADARVPQVFPPLPEAEVPLDRARDLLVDRGYQEVITYSLVAPRLHRLLFPGEAPMPLTNPISADMAELRLSLWPGLIRTLLDNLSRQQERIRIFECGVNFLRQADDIEEKICIGGLLAGSREPEGWANPRAEVDFYDAKADLEALLALSGRAAGFAFEPAAHPALHPGQSARILADGHGIGWLGALHPRLARTLDLAPCPFLFEVEIETILAGKLPVSAEISRFPAVRRDIAVVVDEALPAAELERTIRATAGDLLKELLLFDVYRGPGIDSGRKSVAFGLILQETSRTLTDDDAEALRVRVVEQLQRECGASIRD